MSNVKIKLKPILNTENQVQKIVEDKLDFSESQVVKT